MTPWHHRIYIIIVALLVAAFFLPACGLRKEDCSAPDGSVVVITPEKIEWAIAANTTLPTDLQDNWVVKVTYPNGTPMPNACLRIWASLAVPSTYGTFQFQYYPKDQVPNVVVNSGFAAQTDENGSYTFSTLIPGGTGEFSDNIWAQSGANLGSASYNITAQ